MPRLVSIAWAESKRQDLLSVLKGWCTVHGARKPGLRWICAFGHVKRDPVVGLFGCSDRIGGREQNKCTGKKSPFKVFVEHRSERLFTLWVFKGGKPYTCPPFLPCFWASAGNSWIRAGLDWAVNHAKNVEQSRGGQWAVRRPVGGHIKQWRILSWA